MNSSFIVALIIVAVVLVAIGLIGLGYYLAGRWWQGGVRWVMGILFGFIFILAAVGIFVAGCTALVMS